MMFSNKLPKEVRDEIKRLKREKNLADKKGRMKEENRLRGS